jgi:PTH1 family peptidyl-tRNA hydrolase
MVALGNPGPEYQLSRHNVGFWLADRLAAESGGRFRPERRLGGDLARITVSGHEIRLLKPMTFMNQSGGPVSAFCAYFRIPPESVLVVHDDLDLPAGSLRLKRGGGHGGHNGLRDIISRCGSGFMRLRIGIGRPPPGVDPVDYVLSRPDPEGETCLLEAVGSGLALLPLLFEKGLEPAMQTLHTSLPSPSGGSPSGESPASAPGSAR